VSTNPLTAKLVESTEPKIQILCELANLAVFFFSPCVFPKLWACVCVCVCVLCLVCVCIVCVVCVVCVVCSVCLCVLCCCVCVLCV